MRPVLLAVAMICLSSACLAEGQTDARFVDDAFDTSKSSWIDSARYIHDTETGAGYLVLGIKGEKATYVDVPAGVWEGFKQAESLGQFFTKEIKGKYEREEGEPLWTRHASAAVEPAAARVECAFNEDCEPLILKMVAAARESVYVAAYAFTRTHIAEALVAAQARGADVRVKVDVRQAEYPAAAAQLAYLERNGIPVARITLQGEYSAMHNKFMVIDRRFVVAGSYNFTTTASVSNWENVMGVDSPEIAERYIRAWEEIVSE
jgi:phosphatidylserine/phosphatidylglycerophosphate/cardiolipin synthase-like enzyme